MLKDFNRVCATVMGVRVEYRRLSDEEREIRIPGATVQLSEFVYIGRVSGAALEMWKENGRYREDEAAHPWDLALTSAH